MIRHKENTGYNETEALKKQINFLSNLIKSHARPQSRANPYRYEKNPVAAETYDCKKTSPAPSKRSVKRTVVRTQFKVVNGAERSSPRQQISSNRFRWKKYVGGRRTTLRKSPHHLPIGRHADHVALGREDIGGRRRLFDLARKKPKNSNAARVEMAPRWTSINGILYRASRTKLARELRKTDRRVEAISMFGVKYRMDATGKTLQSCNTNVATTPARIHLGRNTFVRTSPSLWTRTSTADARHFASRVVNRSIQRVLACEQSRKRKDQLSKNNNRYCMFFNRFGKCLKKDRNCPFIHDPDKVAVCTRFLRGTCRVTDCAFSHVVAPSKMPVCKYFLQGRCSSENCPYRHVKVASRALVCPQFLRGFCPMGDKCKKLHTLDCPDFIGGKCSKGSKCPLRHPPLRKKSKTDKERVHEREPKEEERGDKEHSHEMPSFIAIGNDSIERESPSSGVEKKDLQIYPRFLVR